jgi:hypothetical protein
MSNAATHIKEQARRIAALEAEASSWKRLSQEWKARHDILAARLAAVPAPAHLNKDGPCDKGAPGAYEVTDPAPAPKGKSWIADLLAAHLPEPEPKP